MHRGKDTPVNLELAFTVYRNMGGNKEGALRALKEDHGLSLTKDTLYKWIAKYKFEERRIEVDARRQADKDATKTAWAIAVAGLLKIIAQYEEYIAGDDFHKDGKKPDHMAVFALSGLYSQLRMYLRNLDYIKEDDSLPDEEVKAEAEEVLRNIYGIG